MNKPNKGKIDLFLITWSAWSGKMSKKDSLSTKFILKFVSNFLKCSLATIHEN